ncbi:MAG: alpha/beta hydrolase [Nocardioides sp.]|uniref:alpha/beta fold hydrolase n=1 Tax=Nocardioides sp. TaxID=35761 RepID=UPI0039E3CC29
MTTDSSRYDPLPAVTAGSGPGLMLIHGAGGTPQLNFPFLDVLAGDRHVVAPYLPGTGPAPHESPLDADVLADRLSASADAHQLDTFAVLGYSLGSALAVRLAARHPGRVRSLILTAGFAHARRSLRATAAVWLALLGGDPEILAHFLASVGFAEQHLSGLSEADYQTLITTLSAAPQPAGTPAQVDLATRIDVRGDLDRITAPTLVIATGADQLVAPAHSRDLATLMPNAREVTIDAGHLIADEQPDAWLHAVTTFLQSVEPAIR